MVSQVYFFVSVLFLTIQKDAVRMDPIAEETDFSRTDSKVAIRLWASENTMAIFDAFFRIDRKSALVSAQT
jgi:hypothetical protein